MGNKKRKLNIRQTKAKKPKIDEKTSEDIEGDVENIRNGKTNEHLEQPVNEGTSNEDLSEGLRENILSALKGIHEEVKLFRRDFNNYAQKKTQLRKYKKKEYSGSSEEEDEEKKNYVSDEDNYKENKEINKDSSTTFRKKNRKEIVEGSNVYVPIYVWESIEDCTSAYTMISTLLNELFEEDILLQSNYKGGKSKTSSGEPPRPQLDPKIMKPMKVAVMKKFAGSMTNGQFGSIVNNILIKLRSGPK